MSHRTFFPIKFLGITMIFIIDMIKNVLFSVKIVAGLMGAIEVLDSINCLILNFQQHNAPPDNLTIFLSSS